MALELFENCGWLFNFKSENLQFADGKLAADENLFLCPKLKVRTF
jgi:hypothetical protein